MVISALAAGRGAPSRKGGATERLRLWPAGMEPHFLLLWPKLHCDVMGQSQELYPLRRNSNVPPHPLPFTSQPDGEEALKVAVKTLLLSGTKCICNLARRWSKLPAVISVLSRLFDWQNQSPDGRHPSQRQGLPGG